MFNFGFSSQLFLSIVLVFICVGFPIFAQDDADDDQSCYSNNVAGKCVEILMCPPALKSVRLQKGHNYRRCGFHGIIEVICCPNEFIIDSTTKSPKLDSKIKKNNETESVTSVSTDQRSRLNNRKCVQVCEEYSNEIKPDITFHIIEGENAEPKEFPHMVALGYNTDTIGDIKWGCGGSLISRDYVLTAAHCIINADQNPPIRAKMGMVNLNEKPRRNKNIQEFDIVNITIHPDYKKWDKLNDIALVKLNNRATYNDYVHPACLYVKDDDPTGMLVTGWGDTEIAGEGSNVLQKARLTAVSLQECNVTYLTRASKNILTTQICAADSKSDTCQGDSGGPLQVQNIANSSVYTIVGVTSYGIGCGSKYPGIYTRVSSYLDWIESIVWGESFP